MKTFVTALVTALVVSVAVVGLVGGNQSGSTLGGYTRLPNSDVVAKSLTLTNSSATSTLTVGCINAYATSTETAIRLVPSVLGATTTAFQGTVYWQYGTCPF